MKNAQLVHDIQHDIQECKYWIDECKKGLRVAKSYGWHIFEIKQAGNSIKKYRLKIKEKQTILNTIK